MLNAVTLPLDVIARLESRHLKLIAVLKAFADRTGRCWPSVRTIAKAAEETVGWVQRNLKEMESLEYFQRSGRTRRGSSIYLLHSRFMGAFSRLAGESPRKPAENKPEPPVVHNEERLADESKERKEVGLEPIRGVPGLRRVAPPIDRADQSPEAKAARRRKWLDRMTGWAGRFFKGNFEAQWAAWELIEAARTRRLDRAEQKQLDSLNVLMRQAPRVGEEACA